MNNYECDNVREVHKLIEIGNDPNATRVYCQICKNRYIIRKDWRDVPLNRQYAKLYKRDIAQPNSNIFYKIHPQYLRQ